MDGKTFFTGLVGDALGVADGATIVGSGAGTEFGRMIESNAGAAGIVSRESCDWTMGALIGAFVGAATMGGAIVGTIVCDVMTGGA